MTPKAPYKEQVTRRYSLSIQLNRNTYAYEMTRKRPPSANKSVRYLAFLTHNVALAVDRCTITYSTLTVADVEIAPGLRE